MKSRVFAVVTALAFFAATYPARAIPLIDEGLNTYDPITGLEWLDLDGPAVYASFNYVEGNLLGTSQPLAGYRYATVAEVNQLFVDAGITNFSNHGADSAIAALIGLLGNTFLPGIDTVGTGGLTADEDPSNPNFIYAMVLISGTDALNNSFAGSAGPFSKDFNVADGFGSFLVRHKMGEFLPLPTATPLPGTLALFLTGLGAFGLLRWRKDRNRGVTEFPILTPF
jgi:hypothetical protein